MDNLAQKIERVYITRGDNCYNWDGVKNDKMLGLQVDKKIHWLHYNWASAYELEATLRGLGIAFIPELFKFAPYIGKAARNFKSVTRLAAHHDDVFSDGSSYVRRAKETKNGAFLWTVQEFIDCYQ